MHPLLVTLILVGSATASCGSAWLARRSRGRRLEADREVQAAEHKREAENAERALQRLETLQRETGFNVAASMREAQQILEQLRRERPGGEG